MLRHAAVVGLRQGGGFDYNEFVDNIVGNYQPIDESALPTIQRLTENLKQLPDKKNFDTQFQLVSAAVPYRPRKVVLHHDIDLIKCLYTILS